MAPRRCFERPDEVVVADAVVARLGRLWAALRWSLEVAVILLTSVVSAGGAGSALRCVRNGADRTTNRMLTYPERGHAGGPRVEIRRPACSLML